MAQIPIFGTLNNVTDGKVASAAQVTFTPPAGMSSTNVQAAIVEALGKAGQWHLGTEINTDNSTTVVPGASVGDLYLNTDTTNDAFGNVYQLTNVQGTNKWVKKLNITSKVALEITTTNRATQIVDGYSHAYLDITNGGVPTLGTDDIMAPANAVLQAITEILHPEQQ